MVHVPLWALVYWTELSHIHQLKHLWASTKAHLDRQSTQQTTKDTTTLYTHVLSTLSSLSWYGNVEGFSAATPIGNLAPYLTEEWFSDEHENQMLYLLQKEIKEDELGGQIDIVETYFLQILTSVYKEGTYDTIKSARWLRQKGQQLATGIQNKLATIFNINENHWVAVVIDFKLSRILYGDSMGGTVDDDLEEVLTWWTHHHTGHAFVTAYLPITRQRDSHSCGLLAWNALANHLLPNRYSLFDAEKLSNERQTMFLRVVEHHNKHCEVSYLL
ncbi:hypothetical protein BJ912DRAFT_853954 [Pholiota molesta]|nr:hypothetical protein BJ912DRAFT_853954 [Pholiota molesta]